MAEEQTETNGQPSQRGYLMLLVGDERGTSDASLGIALRAAGHNLRVHIIEFVKGGRDRGEVAAVSFLTGVTLSQYGRVSVGQTSQDVDGPVISPDRLESALQEALRHVQQRVTNILILDGLLTLVEQGAVEEDRILELVNNAAPWLDIIVSGASAPEGLKEAADTVTVIEKIKASERDTTEPLRRGIHY